MLGTAMAKIGPRATAVLRSWLVCVMTCRREIAKGHVVTAPEVDPSARWALGHRQ